MDIFAHSLWAGAAGKAANLKKKKPLKIWLMVFFGFFPDLFAFAPAFSWSWASRIFPFIPKIERLGPDNIEPLTQNGRFIFQLTHNLYNLSHSLFVFFLVFGLVWLIFRHPLGELSGWFLHILMDIPSHSYRFFPTPFLWPISDFKINGISWASFNFLMVNYALLGLTYFLIYILSRKQGQKKPLDRSL